MGRMKLVNGVPLPFSAEEEAQRDAEEAAWTPPDNNFPASIVSDETKALRLLLRNVAVAAEDQALKDELLIKLGDQK